MDYISCAVLQNELIDCRMVQLELGFYLLSQEQIKSIGSYLFVEIDKMLEEKFYVSWMYGDRRVKKDRILRKIEAERKWVDFSFEGNVFSPIVWDEKSFKQYDSQLLFDTNPVPTGISVDYAEKFCELFHDVSSPEQCKNVLLELFNASGKKKIAYWRNHDISGLFSSCPYTKYPDLYRGQLTLKVNVTCLGQNAIGFSEKFTALARGVEKMTSHVSGRVALSPIDWPGPCSGHMIYFGSGKIKDISHRAEGFLDVEWNPHNYICGAEWWNIISPLQRKHLPQLISDAKTYKNVDVEELDGGGVIVQSKKNILQTDIPELADMKRLLYRALFPGNTKITMEHLKSLQHFAYRIKPRLEWEMVPMFSDEIVVSPDFLEFRHIDFEN